MILTELAWAAGFFDGEGHTGGRRESTTVFMRVGQCEPSTLVRFQKAIGGLGTLAGPYRRGNGLGVWSLDVSNYENVQAAIAMLWGFMSEPKRLQASAALTASRQQHIKRRAAGAGRTGKIPSPVCHKGHARVKGKQCPACRRERYLTLGS